jgi:hypothetical protein
MFSSTLFLSVITYPNIMTDEKEKKKRIYVVLLNLIYSILKIDNDPLLCNNK